jgi:hypothetical protein
MTFGNGASKRTNVHLAADRALLKPFQLGDGVTQVKFGSINHQAGDNFLDLQILVRAHFIA